MQAGVSVLMVSQASSDSSICLVVEGNDAFKAEQALNLVFEKELSRSQVGAACLRTVREGGVSGGSRARRCARLALPGGAVPRSSRGYVIHK